MSIRDWLTKKLLDVTVRLKAAADRASKTAEGRWMDVVNETPEQRITAMEARADDVCKDPVHPMTMVVALTIAGLKAQRLAEKLKELEDAGNLDLTPAVRAEALRALDTMESLATRLGESGHLPSSNVGQVMATVVKARMALGVNP